MILCSRTTARTGEKAREGGVHPPSPVRKQMEGREGRSGLRSVVTYVTINNVD